MAAFSNKTYFVVRDKHDVEYLFPLNSVRSKDAITDDELDSCVGKDVVERYSGNIDIVPS